MTMLPVIGSGRFCRLASFVLLLASLGIPAAAQTNPPASDPAEQMPGDTEDVAAGATIVRGRYTAGDASAEWEAALKDGKPERIAEWRSYGDFGNANVVFSFHNGELMHYGEHGRRRGGQAGSMDGFRRVELNLSFAGGRFSDGFKTVDGIETEPGEAEVRAAQLQAKAALERLATARPAWQGAGQSTSFSITSVPASGPSAEARQLAGAGGEIVFRCSDALHVVLGAAEDRLVVETRDRPPVTLRRQPSGARYDYFGAGWGAERRGEEIRLEEASGRSLICRIVSAAPPPSALPPNGQSNGQ